jgi:hypothetical protein
MALFWPEWFGFLALVDNGVLWVLPGLHGDVCPNGWLRNTASNDRTNGDTTVAPLLNDTPCRIFFWSEPVSGRAM